jgi:hypothetical protein
VYGSGDALTGEGSSGTLVSYAHLIMTFIAGYQYKSGLGLFHTLKQAGFSQVDQMSVLFVSFPCILYQDILQFRD